MNIAKIFCSFLLFWISTEAVLAKDSNIIVIQQFLADKGCEPNGIDGQWGRGSRAAAARYFAVSGIELGPQSDLTTWPERYLAPACGDEPIMETPPAEALNKPVRCPDLGWTETDEDYAGRWVFEWSILNVSSGDRDWQGQDRVSLFLGRGTILTYGSRNPRHEYRETFDITYGGGRICLAGLINLHDATPVKPMSFIGAFADRKFVKTWPGGDQIRLEVFRIPEED